MLEKMICIGKNILKNCNLLCTAQYEYYLRLVNIVHPLHAFNRIDLPLFLKTDLNHISM